jgi:indolepyruvate decarboxylase
MRDAVAALTAVIVELGRSWQRTDVLGEEPRAVRIDDGKLRQAQLWAAIEEFLQPGDIIVAEQGTAFFGAQELRLPSGTTFIGQPLWGSIGYTLPAALGAQLAAPERRTVLLIGDGSAQLTAQEIGTMLREGCNSIIVVINNGGYTVERAIHGPTQRYNDIAAWNWSLLPAALGGTSATISRASTSAELTAALGSAHIHEPGNLVLLEAVLPRTDVPDGLAAVARALAATNSGRSQEPEANDAGVIR